LLRPNEGSQACEFVVAGYVGGFFVAVAVTVAASITVVGRGISSTVGRLTGVATTVVRCAFVARRVRRWIRRGFWLRFRAISSRLVGRVGVLTARRVAAARAPWFPSSAVTAAFEGPCGNSTGVSFVSCSRI
jgi:hypothetical protein